MRFLDRYRRRHGTLVVKPTIHEAEAEILKVGMNAQKERIQLLELENERLRKCLHAEEERVLRIAADFSARFADFNAVLASEIAESRPAPKQCEDCTCGGPY